MSIPFFRYPHLFAQQREEILTSMTTVMDRGAFILQSDLVEFETALATLTGLCLQVFTSTTFCTGWVSWRGLHGLRLVQHRCR